RTGVSRAQRSTKWCAADPGPLRSVAVPGQGGHSAAETRVTPLMAPLRFALPRLPGTPAGLLFLIFFLGIRWARPGRLCARAVEAAALVAMEAVLRVGVNVDFAVAAALLLDHLDVAHRDRGILVAEMHLRRDFRLLVGVLGDLSAVIADGSREAVELAGRQKGDRASHAEAHDGDRPFLLELVDRRLRVAQHCAPIGIGDEFARIGDLVRRIAGFEVLLLTIEQRRR